MQYTPPSPEDIERLKTELGLTGQQMADLFGVAGNRAFRRYTSPSGNNRREISAHMLFFAMARLELSADAIERILDRMRKAGATIDLSAPAGEQPPS
ncbi:transcriptional regulator [Paraburkholderia sp. SOS3]|uniref:transcriptional regulator n=1 Tax=Paraburkholderia sp. SOS3 TaxID=1926494 RepID=UPI0009476494|nr:transcriptional regulator [Paraburkholderia sp. SOS3]APR37877.1 transcriptional regulator [Paraburkholderia sp. SOS3]APR40048.1 transcriptional regulator [Paraburkholderia sp. SOS3]APR40487.1 transcriptional regulator [Paraburkholderia sp. SOS3]